MSEADVINEQCRDDLPVGTMFSPASTYSAINTILDSWAQFNQADLDDAANPANITISNTSTFTSAILTINYTINGKNGTVHVWARHYGMTVNGASTSPGQYGSSSSRAVLIIPGSGNNETCDMMNSTGYDNVLFPVGTATGDAYVYQYPGQDLRSIYGTNSPQKKFGIGAIENHMITAGTSTAILALMEICVIMKYLRTASSVNATFPQYTKIGIMGLSKGAFYSMMGALYTEPAAAIIASGFSLKEYRFNRLGNGNNIPSIEDTWDQDTLIDAVQNSATKFYYTCSNSGNEIAIMKEEAADSETATALAGSNFTYNMHGSGHVYPSGTLTWLQGALA